MTRIQARTYSIYFLLGPNERFDLGDIFLTQPGQLSFTFRIQSRIDNLVRLTQALNHSGSKASHTLKTECIKLSRFFKINHC
ncbi:hypothetical protein BpHYR1_051777 [Brachionus plicatilis]|uniref:Uncharacterized protein n=1 Tax=Brachionus plicatilis TaxID=10195 RepID=A0A3M7R6K5_BRAPC|nr:hypothetical protein BpHYR1_051777 [Brachionus plicatilis]